jgi:ornithine decarboxylase
MVLDVAETNCTSCTSTNKVSVLPSSVSNILDCARHEIQQLENENAATITVKDDDEDALDDGFMCIDLNVLTTKLQKWYQLFPFVTPYFAVKCNPDPMVAHWLARHSSITGSTTGTSTANKLPIGFDCASLAELKMAKRELVSNNPHQEEDKDSTLRMVYANPQRAEDDLYKCLDLFPPTQDLRFTVDGVEELHKIDKACTSTGKSRALVHLIVRILVPDDHSQIPLGEKFGIALEGIPELCETAQELDLPPFIGVSFHCGSGCHDPETYQTALKLAKQALQSIDECQNESSSTTGSTIKKCWLLDIGGGFPGWDGLGGDHTRFSGTSGNTKTTTNVQSDDPDTTAAIATAIQPLLQDFRKNGLTLIAEPGRYFVEAAACLVSRIYKTYQEGDTTVYQIAHGVHGVFKDVLLCNESFVPMALLKAHGDDDDDDDDNSSSFLFHSSRIRGPSGDPNDVVCAECQLPTSLQVGDWLVFDRMGAYTLSIASRTGRPIVRYVQGTSTTSSA